MFFYFVSDNLFCVSSMCILLVEGFFFMVLMI